MLSLFKNFIGLSFLKVFFLNLVLCFNIFAAGEVDTTFRAAVEQGFISGNLKKVAVQNDGKIIIAGSFRVVNQRAYTNIVRLNPDATPDTSFNPPEFYAASGTHGTINDMKILADGKIIIGGDFVTVGTTQKVYLARLNSDGSLDNSFNPPSTIATSNTTAGVFDLDTAADNSVIAVGNFVNPTPGSSPGFARFNADGSLNPNFRLVAAGGIPKSVAFQSDGKILIADQQVIRLNADGTTDTSFLNPVLGASVRVIFQQSNGKILIGGEFSGLNGGLRRFNIDGSDDLSFNTNGTGAGGKVFSIVSISNGQFYIGGDFQSYNGVNVRGIARLNADGALDTSFSQTSTAAFASIDVQPDGKVLGVGFGVARRFNTDGSVDSSFQVRVTVNGGGLKVIQQPDGKILVGGDLTLANGVSKLLIARFNLDGTLDTSFTQTAYSAVGAMIFALALQSDGKILVGGIPGGDAKRISSNGTFEFTFPDTQNTKDIQVLPDGKIVFVGQNGLFKIFNPNGTLFADYTSRVFGGEINKVYVQPDGKIWIVGGFTRYLSQLRSGIAKLNADGSLDNSFNPPNGAGGATIYDFAVQADGKVVVGGNFASFNSDTTRKFLTRLNADGSLDSSFTPSFNQAVYAVKLDSNNKILVGGNFTIVNNVPASRITRLTGGGAIDPAFNVGSGANDTVFNINLQSDGNILVAGKFTKINGISNIGLARLLNAPTAARTKFDFDGDGKADIAVFRPSTGYWYWLNSSDNSFKAFQFGQNGDRIAPADYDGDGKTDIAVWRADVTPGRSYFYIWQSATNSFRFEQFGSGGDLPISGDWDGDAKDDVAVYRGAASAGTQSLFLYRPSSAPTVDFRMTVWGTNGDRPLRGDFDGDGKLDAAVFRPSNNRWYVLKSSDGQFTETEFALASDQPVSGDFDGDGRTNIAVFRSSNGTWYTSQNPATNYGSIQFGANGDIPTAADFDGDGRTDASVFRPSSGSWYLLRTTQGFTGVQFGSNGDVPVPSAYNY